MGDADMILAPVALYLLGITLDALLRRLSPSRRNGRFA